MPLSYTSTESAADPNPRTASRAASRSRSPYPRAATPSPVTPVVGTCQVGPIRYTVRYTGERCVSCRLVQQTTEETTTLWPNRVQQDSGRVRGLVPVAHLDLCSRCRAVLQILEHLEHTTFTEARAAEFDENVRAALHTIKSQRVETLVRADQRDGARARGSGEPAPPQ